MKTEKFRSESGQITMNPSCSMWQPVDFTIPGPVPCIEKFLKQSGTILSWRGIKELDSNGTGQDWWPYKEF